MAYNIDNQRTQELRELVHAVIESKENIPSKAAPLIEETLLKMDREGLSLKEALEIPSSFIDGIYLQGYHFFQSGKYEEALPFFHSLQQLDPGDSRLTFAIAATLHHLKRYEEAAGYYFLYTVSDLTHPLPYYHMYDCFTKMGQSALASAVLQQAGRLAEQAPEHATLKGKIALELDHLKLLEKGVKETQNAFATA